MTNRKGVAWMVGLMSAGLSAANAQECLVGDPNRQAEALAAFELNPADAKSLTRDLNNLRTAALILDANGQLEACVTVVEAMDAMIAHPTAIQERTRAIFAAASPIAPAGRPTTARDLLGQRVLSLSGRPAAEIDDLWLAGGTVGNFALLSVGGFFGIAADHIAVPLELLRADVREVYYVGLTTDDLAAAPRFSSRDLLSDPAWLEQNRAFYEPLVEQLTAALTN